MDMSGLLRWGCALLLAVTHVPLSLSQSPTYTIFTPTRSLMTQDSNRVTLELQNDSLPDALHQIVDKAGMALIWSRRMCH